MSFNGRIESSEPDPLVALRARIAEAQKPPKTSSFGSGFYLFLASIGEGLEAAKKKRDASRR